MELHGWFDDDASVLLAMEYFKHGDLQHFISSSLPERDVGIIARQLLEGLNVMHQHGFTHRDLKPQVTTPSSPSQAQSSFLYLVLVAYVVLDLSCYHIYNVLVLDLCS